VAHNGRVLHRTFLPSTDSSLDGSIYYLSREHAGNLHDRGIVDISAKSINSSHDPKHAADFQTATFFHSNCAPDHWLCSDVKDLRV
jgi:hypothetical protein